MSYLYCRICLIYLRFRANMCIPNQRRLHYGS
nr:MAG TPA: hypothetical protein [Caudoviricetes sp.]DAU33693.1 MAG TPA: hypothetical protein [Bacteriophage sp.]